MTLIIIVSVTIAVSTIRITICCWYGIIVKSNSRTWWNKIIVGDSCGKKRRTIIIIIIMWSWWNRTVVIIIVIWNRSSGNRNRTYVKCFRSYIIFVTRSKYFNYQFILANCVSIIASFPWIRSLTIVICCIFKLLCKPIWASNRSWYTSLVNVYLCLTSSRIRVQLWASCFLE